MLASPTWFFATPNNMLSVFLPPPRSTRLILVCLFSVVALQVSAMAGLRVIAKVYVEDNTATADYSMPVTDCYMTKMIVRPEVPC